MKLNAAKEYVSDTLTEARKRLAEIGVFAEQNIAEEITDGNGYIYGALVVGQDIVKEEECLFFPLDVEVKEGEASDGDINECAEDFKSKINALVEVLAEKEDKARAIAKFGEEIQKTRELELLGQVKEMERDTAHNLKIAFTAGAAMLILAAICILISRLL